MAEGGILWSEQNWPGIDALLKIKRTVFVFRAILGCDPSFSD